MVPLHFGSSSVGEGQETLYLNQLSGETPRASAVAFLTPNDSLKKYCFVDDTVFSGYPFSSSLIGKTTDSSYCIIFSICEIESNLH